MKCKTEYGNMYKLILFLILFSLARYGKADAPHLYVKHFIQADKLEIVSRIYWNLDQHSDVPDGFFTANNETFIHKYILGNKQIRVESFFPQAMGGRNLNRTTYVAIRIYIDSSIIFETEHFGQHSSSFVVSKYFDYLYRPSNIQIRVVENNSLHLKVFGEFTNQLRQNDITASSYYFKTDSYNLLNGDGVIGDSILIVDLIRKYSNHYNKIGKKYYDSKDLNSAVDFFSKSLDIRNDQANIYSNMGLIYYKMLVVGNPNFKEKSIQMSREALNRAKGKYANIIKGNTHYNLGKLFEHLKDYSEALASFSLAEQFNSKQTYKDAILRMKKKLE